MLPSIYTPNTHRDITTARHTASTHNINTSKKYDSSTGKQSHTPTRHYKTIKAELLSHILHVNKLTDKIYRNTLLLNLSNQRLTALPSSSNAHAPDDEKMRTTTLKSTSMYSITSLTCKPSICITIQNSTAHSPHSHTYHIHSHTSHYITVHSRIHLTSISSQH